MTADPFADIYSGHRLEQLPTAEVVDLAATGTPGPWVWVTVRCPFHCRRRTHTHAWELGRHRYPVRPAHCAISRPYRLTGTGMPTPDTLELAAAPAGERR